jgi:hypothetical protein
MENANAAFRRRQVVPTLVLNAGGPIRTLSVSLLAVAAIAASVLLTRSRERAPTVHRSAGETGPVEPMLDAIRAAGL